MTDKQITELCKLSGQLDHNRIDAIITNLKQIIIEENKKGKQESQREIRYAH